ncbi:colicin immunity domain-containing protein [Streptomyces sp. NPDC046716]|uniref:colicin immunity domain-containing protein n=1 Tax=Streptomyces sp. NPDC046716 TaxID=3157093 RepID=UPI0033FD0AA8
MLNLLDSFLKDNISAPAFADGWWQERRAAQAGGERTQGQLSQLLEGVFMTLEDYSVDPSLREPGDLTDTELRARIKEITQSQQL